MTTLNSQTNILKEVYEKGKPRKMDAVHEHEETSNPRQGKMPPFMKGRKAPNEDARKQKSAAAQRRLTMMQKKPKGK